MAHHCFQLRTQASFLPTHRLHVLPGPSHAGGERRVRSGRQPLRLPVPFLPSNTVLSATRLTLLFVMTTLVVLQCYSLSCVLLCFLCHVVVYTCTSLLTPGTQSHDTGPFGDHQTTAKHHNTGLFGEDQSVTQPHDTVLFGDDQTSVECHVSLPLSTTFTVECHVSSTMTPPISPPTEITSYLLVFSEMTSLTFGNDQCEVRDTWDVTPPVLYPHQWFAGLFGGNQT
jgi:hypothetical protein